MRELRMNATSISRDGLISQRSPWRRGPATDAAAANHWSTAYLRSSFALLRFVLLTTGKSIPSSDSSVDSEPNEVGEAEKARKTAAQEDGARRGRVIA